MFEPAPDFNADDKGCAIAAKQFYERVLHYAYQYNITFSVSIVSV